MSYSLPPHGLQHTRLPCLSLSLRVCSYSHPLSLWWCHLTFSSCATCFSCCPQSFPISSLFQWVIPLLQWPKYWSFSISPSSEYLGLISFRIHWFPCCPRNSQESYPAPQLESINFSMLSLLYGPTLVSVHDYWKSHSFDYSTFSSLNLRNLLQKANKLLQGTLYAPTWAQGRKIKATGRFLRAKSVALRPASLETACL